jgi:hypothetical protein
VDHLGEIRRGDREEEEEIGRQERKEKDRIEFGKGNWWII